MREEELLDGKDVRFSALLAMLEPVFVLARLLGLSLADLEHLVRTGYFRELRGRGLSLPQVAKRLGKSLRTITQLSKEAELEPELHSERLQLRRKLIRVLASKGALSELELIRLCPQHRAADVRDEIELLLEQSLVSSNDGLLALQQQLVEFVHGQNDHKIAVLRMYMQASLQLVYARFFSHPTDQHKDHKNSPTAMLRVLSFRAKRAQLSDWASATYTGIAEAIERIDRDAAPENSHETHVVFAAVEHPEDSLFRKRQAKGAPR